MDRLEEPHIQELVRLFQEGITIDFNHSIITWTIDNVIESVATHSTFVMPPISLGKGFGFCNLWLTPQFNLDSIFIQIKIHQVPDESFISYRFGFKSGNVPIWHNEQLEEFKKEFETVATYPTIANYFSATTMTIVLLCELIISTKVSKSETSIIPLLDRTEYAICVDFYHLYKIGYLSDLTLRVGETEIYAHKAILSSKSEVFRKMITEMKKNENTLSLPEIDLFTMQSFLHYIYIGNTEVWSTFYCPTISLCEYAEKFEIVDLKTYVQPYEVDITGRLIARTFQFEFKVEGFSDLRETDFSIPHPIFKDQFGSFSLRLSHSNSSNGGFRVNLEPSEIKENFSLHIKMNIGHSETKKSKTYELKTCLIKGSADIIEVGSFTEKDLLICSTSSPLLLDILTIQGRYIVSNHSESDNFVYRTVDKPLIAEFIGLKALIDSSLYSDMKFIADGREFLAHKSILGSRLPCFENLFKIDKRIKEISMDEVKAPTMESFLTYLYTGIIGNEVENLLNLLPIWNKYGNNTFGAMLFNLLTQNINVKNVCHILSKLYSLEDTEFFDSLKSAAITYLCRNFVEVESSEVWSNFTIENKIVALIILSVISGAYRQRYNESLRIAQI